ncbi:Sec-independent protein translocase protein TatB [Gammaproteobacteria bacterium]|nr:Sec-independent protein translocase protein TatB [Gammaproteobacteria bacterium]MDA7709621.1 Sec-independent protein translocase protein TatB [Gammaproteobacteria bacterium]MDA7734969.1 Sec-independent protein translocase protein TatB [Gammaproteobacteria bacterium]MDA7800693.1 Sec-independent protein translocase protein TatB [Gammaproteobacteria bacterium]MDA8674226.1 Sec-independent protein translocase protein TatB [Gammaproteobacteria bacterium]
MFQVGFLEIAIILILGLLIIGPKRLPDLIKTILKFYKKVQKQISNLKSDLEEDIGTEEIKKDVFNEMRMEELDLFDKSDKNE